MNFLFDLKYAWRLLNKSRGYALMCALVVALSVGLAVWSFTLAYSQVWKPLEFRGSDRWYSVQLAPTPKGDPLPAVDAYTLQEVLAQTRSADYLGAFTNRIAVLGDGQTNTGLRAAAITPRLFAAARVAPLLGRVFEETDGHAEAAGVAVLSFETWQTYFASDPRIVGKTVRIDAQPVQIIGVMPEDFHYFRDFHLWTPLQMPRVARPSDSTLTFTPFIALKENQNVNTVLNEMRSAARKINSDYPDLFKSTRTLMLIPAMRTYNYGNGPIVAVIGLLACGVLLLGCVNISMVFLARLLERSRELALRTALGASRSRLMRRSLLETAIVVLVGLAGGCALAFMGVEWTHSISELMSRVLATGGGGNVPELRPFDLFAALLAAAGVWLFSTLIPAWRVAKQDPAVVLAGSGKGATVRGSHKSVALLVGLQVAVSTLVLVLCGSLVMAIEREANKPSGLNTENVMLSVAATQFGDRYKEPAQRLRYWDDLAAAVESKIPGAKAAFMTASPTRPTRVAATVEGRQGTQKQGTPTLPFAAVSDDYFDVARLRLRAGRLFDTTDNSASMDVAVVDEGMAARYWPGQNVLGKRVQLNSSGDSPWLTIVGVVSAVSGRPYNKEEVGVLYRPMRQAVPPQFQLIVRLPNAATDHRTSLRAAAYAVDRDLPLHNLQLLDDYIAAVNMGFTAMIPIMIAIAIITAILAASGLFGLISRSVAQRTQEVGIRRALGATAWRGTAMFRRQGTLYLSISIVGIGLGVIVSTLVSSIFTNILQFVMPVSFGVVLLMAAVIFTASYLPTRRAVALEPGDALRYE